MNPVMVPKRQHYIKNMDISEKTNNMILNKKKNYSLFYRKYNNILFLFFNLLMIMYIIINATMCKNQSTLILV